MTHELNGIGGTAVAVAHSATPSPPSSSTSMKHALRSATKARAEEEEHNLLVREEEKLMSGTSPHHPELEDEEITSVEEEPDNEATERTMLTVALVQSVVETTAPAGPASPTTRSSAAKLHGGGGSGPPSPGSHTYGLRKRRRPSGQDLERLEHFQSTKDGGLARVVAANKSEPDEAPLIAPLPSAAAHESAPPPSRPPSSPKATAKRSFTAASAAPASLSATSTKLPPPPQTQQPVPLSLSSVPNPLSKLLDSPATMPVPPPVDDAGDRLHTAIVPCPLPGPQLSELPPEQTEGGSNNSGLLSSDAAAPSFTAEEGCTDDAADKRKVTIHEPDLISRKRGFSVDLDFFELGDDVSTGPNGTGGRERAFSFECFAFGINADEPLPPLEPHAQPSHPGSFLLDHHGRPRGDSIIFDPVSFQEGGIHEQNALESLTSPPLVVPHLDKQPDVPTLSSLTADAAAVPTSSSKVTDSGSVPPRSIVIPDPAASESGSAPPCTGGVAAPPPSSAALDPSGATTPSSTSATFSLDLLNKDGRIGIYLPEARRARIARFHAKRSRRIWRKRIKYDCRKKLADSRPRIKGRFVKRTDGDD